MMVRFAELGEDDPEFGLLERLDRMVAAKFNDAAPGNKVTTPEGIRESSIIPDETKPKDPTGPK